MGWLSRHPLAVGRQASQVVTAAHSHLEVFLSALTVAPDHRTLVRDGKPFFWLADTIWSAFTNVTDEEWIAYLDKRSSQGFTVLQLNALAQWDRCGCAFDRYPFATSDHG